ncbi:down syndrome cell adhesion molecule [Trichonephila clavipes]|nr:down syndrome cell adhesion molecule [Trichonephila clavipes]
MPAMVGYLNHWATAAPAIPVIEGPTAPQIQTSTQVVHVRKSEEARFSCSASGDPPLNIVWSREGFPLSLYPENRYLTRESEGRGVKISEVVIKSSQRKDSDVFTCSASNPFGEDKTTVRLVVQGFRPKKNESVLVRPITFIGPWVAWWSEHRTQYRKAWVRSPMPSNTLRVHTEYVLVKSVNPKVLRAESRVQGTGEYFPPLQSHDKIEEVSPSIVPSGNFPELIRPVTYMVLKAYDRRTSSPLPR